MSGRVTGPDPHSKVIGKEILRDLSQSLQQLESLPGFRSRVASLKLHGRTGAGAANSNSPGGKVGA